MAGFFDLDFTKNLTIEEYLGTIRDEEELDFSTTIFNDAQAFLKFLLAVGQIASIPELRIRNSDYLNAEGISDVVVVHSGLVVHAFRCCFLDDAEEIEIGEIFGFRAPRYATRCAFLIWVIAHELTHARRRHDDVLLAVGVNDCIAQQATEMDADLCAAAYAVRWIQHVMHPETDALQIKSFVLRSLYDGIREFPDPLPESGHHSTVNRLFKIVSKLASLRPLPIGAPDPNFDKPESQQAAGILFNQLISLETARAKRKGIDVKDYLKELANFIANEGWKPVSDKWEEIKAEVATKSGTKT
jgi:hypothetical protein